MNSISNETITDVRKVKIISEEKFKKVYELKGVEAFFDSYYLSIMLEPKYVLQHTWFSAPEDKPENLLPSFKIENKPSKERIFNFSTDSVLTYDPNGTKPIVSGDKILIYVNTKEFSNLGEKDKEENIGILITVKNDNDWEFKVGEQVPQFPINLDKRYLNLVDPLVEGTLIQEEITLKGEQGQKVLNKTDCLIIALLPESYKFGKQKLSSKPTRGDFDIFYDITLDSSGSYRLDEKGKSIEGAARDLRIVCYVSFYAEFDEKSAGKTGVENPYKYYVFNKKISGKEIYENANKTSKNLLKAFGFDKIKNLKEAERLEKYNDIINRIKTMEAFLINKDPETSRGTVTTVKSPTGQ